MSASSTASAIVPPIKFWVCHVCKEIVYDDTFSHEVDAKTRVICCTKECFQLYQTAFFRQWEAKKPKEKPKPKPIKKGHQVGNTNSNIQKVVHKNVRFAKK